ncbi:MAG: WD40 repeat domain-containing protein [Candidatus Eremiobacterota bacterium]
MKLDRNLVWILVFTACLGYWADRALRQDAPRRIGTVGQELRAAAVSPDGRFVAGIRPAGKESWTLHAWETRTGKEVLSPQKLPHPPAPNTPLAWSPDGRTLAAGAEEAVFLYDLEKRRQIRQLKASWMVREVRFNASGLLMARSDKAVFLWEASSGKPVWHHRQDYLLQSRLSEDGAVLATAAFEEGIYLWSVPQRKLLRRVEPDSTPVGLEFCRQDAWLAACFRYRTQRERDSARIYRVADGAPTGPLLGHPHLAGFGVSRDGARLLTRTRLDCRIWEPSSGKLIHQRDERSQRIDALSPDGIRVVTLPEGAGALTVWQADSGRSLATLDHPEPPRAFRFASDRLLQVVGGCCAVWEF